MHNNQIKHTVQANYHEDKYPTLNLHKKEANNS